jgi:versiconal hemiacetal acetate esterase
LLIAEFSVEVKYDEYPGYPHYFWTFPSKDLEGAAGKYIDNLIKGVQFVLS